MSNPVLRSFAIAAAAAALLLPGCKANPPGRQQASAEQAGTGGRAGAGVATESMGTSYSAGGVTSTPEQSKYGSIPVTGGTQAIAGGSGSLGLGKDEPTTNLEWAQGYGNFGQQAPDAGIGGAGTAGGPSKPEEAKQGGAGGTTAPSDAGTGARPR